MKRRQILDILFWILLAIGIILLIWKLVGKSPSEISIIAPFILMLILKMWSVSDELKEFKHGFKQFKQDVKLSFIRVSDDFKNLNFKKKEK